MSENTEQRVYIKFCYKLGKTATETYQMLMLAYGVETMSRARVFEWFKRFKKGRTTVESDEREGRPSTSRNEEMIQKIRTAIRDAVRRKRPEFNESGSWKLHHDNTPAHSAHVVQQFLAKHGIPVVSQPPYSPDLAPCDFFLFPKIKMALKSKRFQDVDEIKQNATEQLRRVSKNDFHRCFQKWQERWRTCMDSEGAYFEGD
ncbi:hypothetical protein AGLY_003760 [Aphis glycines]|uniref:Uncharacterized protein n=1 Tax=Aphis glycines TaxID=307491 RepID=A0A6G0TZ44_APHGL|nr:hypothetical protein AGLY_003760 [Aphis glycines]